MHKPDLSSTGNREEWPKKDDPGTSRVILGDLSYFLSTIEPDAVLKWIDGDFPPTENDLFTNVSP